MVETVENDKEQKANCQVLHNLSEFEIPFFPVVENTGCYVKHGQKTDD